MYSEVTYGLLLPFVGILMIAINQGLVVTAPIFYTSFFHNKSVSALSKIKIAFLNLLT